MKTSADNEHLSTRHSAAQRMAEPTAGHWSHALDSTPRQLRQTAQLQALQRAGTEEEQPLQPKMVQRVGTEEEQPIQNKVDGGGLPGPLRAGIESLSGLDMSGVQVHANSDRPAQLNAHAFAQGQDIHLAAGQEKHLPHEAWHVVQQAQGRVQANVQLAGNAVNDDPALEAEADHMGDRALQRGQQIS